MDDLTNRAEAIDILTRMSTNHFYGHREQEALKLGAEALSAERRGRWEVFDILDYAQRPTGRKVLRCSLCGHLTDDFRSIVDYNHNLTNYCPNCGARMEVFPND